MLMSGQLAHSQTTRADDWHVINNDWHTSGQILHDIFVFRHLGISSYTAYSHSSEKSCFEQKNAWFRFAIILFKLHDIW